MENSMAVPQKLKAGLPHGPEIPLLGITPEELDRTQMDTYKSVFMSTIHDSQVVKQPKCPLAGE
jgi:hypothetical protein